MASATLFPDDPFAERAFAEVEAERQAGNWSQALDRALKLLQHRLGQSSGVAHEVGDRILIERLADLAVPFGQVEAADHLLAALASECSQTGDTFIADYVTLKRVHLALTAGRYPEARELLESLQNRTGPLSEVPYRADDLPVWEDRCRWRDSGRPAADRALFFSRLYLSMGQWLAGQGFYGQASVLLERGADHAQPPASALACRAWLPLRLQLAGVLLEQGEPDACDRILQEIHPRLNENEGPGWLVQWLELTGHRLLLLGQYGQALQHFSRVTEICAHGGFERAFLGALLNQAQVLIVLNQISVAEELLDEATQLAQVLDDPAATIRIAWLTHLADARSHSLTDGVAIAPSAIEMQHGRTVSQGSTLQDRLSPLELPQAANFLAFFEERALGVQWLLARGDVAGADQHLDALQEIFGECESPLIQLRLYLLAGMIAYDGADYPEAVRIFAEVCPHLEERGLKPELWQAYRFRGWCAVRLHAPEEEQVKLTKRTQQLMDELASSLPASARAIYLLNKWTVEENSLRQEIDSLVAQKQKVDSSPWYLRPWRRWQLWKQLHFFLDKLDAHRRELAAREVGTQQEVPPTTPSLWSRLWGQPWRSGTISFLVLPDRVFASWAGWMSLDFTVAPISRLTIRELVAAWHREVANLDSCHQLGSLTDQLNDGLQLSTILHRLPRRVRRLTIVADDSLHGFPFAIIRHQERYLIDQYAITIAFDRTLTPTRRSRPGQPRALTFAVASGTENVPPLPGTIEEVRTIQRWFQKQGVQTSRFIDHDAHKQAILQSWSQAHFVHAACHGVFTPDQPDASGLVLLADQEDGETPFPEGSPLARLDGIRVLSLRELSQLDMRHLEHVTLSCCWGADNFIAPGRWIISLPETLCRQGVGSVLACLWAIDDDVGIAFCVRFYQHLERMPRDQALQQTQRDCLSNRLLDPEQQKKTDHPFYWSGYRLHGTGTPLPL